MSVRHSSVAQVQLHPGTYMQLVNRLLGLEVGRQQRAGGFTLVQHASAQGLDQFPGQVNDQPALCLHGKDGVEPGFQGLVLLVAVSQLAAKQQTGLPEVELIDVLHRVSWQISSEH